MTDKQKFLKSATIICDTREQQNEHIIQALDSYGVQDITQELNHGDYSFSFADTDFSLTCSIERKANVDELWSNITAERERFEKEIGALHRITGQPILLLENIPSRGWLKAYHVPEWQMKNYHRKVKAIGEVIDSTLQSWQAANRYNLRVCYVDKPEKTAAVMLEIFYWHWRNYSELCKPLKAK